MPRRPAASAAPGPAKKVEVGNAPTRGPKNAPITVVLFSDFQCPFCGRVEPSIVELEKAYPGKVRVAWKNFPLSFHNNAKPAAEAALAAHEQGKFWQMHDILFKNQQALSAAGSREVRQGDRARHGQVQGRHGQPQVRRARSMRT